MSKPTESETAIAVMDPLIGSIFDKRFRIEEKIASGGFGAIYRAVHVKSGHPIALKVLHPDLAQDLGVLARFRREGATMTSLRNAHTITAYELGQAADRTLFIVMELLSGESVFDRYEAGGPMDWKTVAKIASQVCESLEEAHALGIVHRDLKPTNIHLERKDDDPDFVKVLDFGIAKIIRGSDSFDSSDITNAGQMIGTLDYMSPEQMVGGTVTGQTDIYTLGIVMYEMITGTRPFPEAQTAAAALAAMLKLRPTPLYLRAPVPEELDRIVMRCLEKDTDRRYASVGELREDLLALLAKVAPDHTRTLALDVGDRETAKTPAIVVADDDVDATTITPPPEKILESLRTPKLERVDDADPWGEEGDDDSDATVADDVEVSRGEATMPRAVVPVAPMPRPLESKHTHTPLPQVVVAPFSSPPRARPGEGQGTPLVTPVPGAFPPPVYPPPGFGAPARGPTYDMSKIAAREATIRRLVWIVAFVVAVGAGIVLATQL